MFVSRSCKPGSKASSWLLNKLLYGPGPPSQHFFFVSSFDVSKEPNNQLTVYQWNRFSSIPLKEKFSRSYFDLVERSPFHLLCKQDPRLLTFRLFFTQSGPVLRHKQENKNQLTEHVAPGNSQLTIGHRVVQAGKDASYSVILLIGFGVTGALVWYVLSELFFGFSPNSVYSKALDIAKADQQVKEVVGEPIKGFGEETSRGRRRHVSFQEYIVDDVEYMRVKFYVSGNKCKATVYADAKKASRGNFEFRYIFLETQAYPSETLILLDNR